MARRAADLGADALLVHPPTAFRERPDRDALILDYHSVAAEAGLPLIAFYLYETAGGISYPPELLAELLARGEVLGMKIATLDSVMTFQDIAPPGRGRRALEAGDHRRGSFPRLQPDVRGPRGLDRHGRGLHRIQAELLADVPGRRSGAIPGPLIGRRRPGPAHVHRPDGGLHPADALVSGPPGRDPGRCRTRPMGTGSGSWASSTALPPACGVWSGSNDRRPRRGSSSARTS